jgi:hypothetical protein
MMWALGRRRMVEMAVVAVLLRVKMGRREREG